MEDGGWRMEDGRCLIPSSDILREIAGLRRKMGSAEVSGEYIYLTCYSISLKAPSVNFKLE
jgi:hypothetical protein